MRVWVSPLETPTGRGPRTTVWRFPTLAYGTSYRTTLSPFPKVWRTPRPIVAMCDLELLAERLTPPAARVPAGVTLEQHLDERLYGALGEKYRGDTFTVAKSRLEYELVTMKALGLSEFFLVAAEVTDFCRSSGHRRVGPGQRRGVGRLLPARYHRHRPGKAQPACSSAFSTLVEPHSLTWTSTSVQVAGTRCWPGSRSASGPRPRRWSATRSPTACRSRCRTWDAV